jgi:PAS domain S-box-containing protein
MHADNPTSLEDDPFLKAGQVDLRVLNSQLQEQANKLREEIKCLTETNASLHREAQERTGLGDRLRQSQRHLAVAQQLSLTGSFTWNAATGKIIWSEETYRIYGIDPSVEPTMELALQRVHPDDRWIFEERARNAPEESRDFKFQHRLLLPDGTIKHIKIVTRHIGMELGAKGFVGALMDITEQKKAEEALKTSENIARGQLEAVKDALGALALVSEPDKLLEHVLRTIADYLGAKSITFCERNSSGYMGLAATFEDNTLQVKTHESFEAERASHMSPKHPVWAEVYRTGVECVIGDMAHDPPQFRLLDREDIPWHPWYGNCACDPLVAAAYRRLVEGGVVFTLTLPMLIGGKVSGMLCTRYTRKRGFQKEEVELTRSLAHQGVLIMQLLRLSRKSREAAVVAERNRMARDIHDTLAQGFAGIIAQLQAAKGLAGLGDASAHIERAENLARSSLEEARVSMMALRPRSLREASLSMALESMLKAVAHDSGLRAEFIIEGEQWPITPDWEVGLLRVAQESLTNTIKHAQAQNFQTTLRFENQKVKLRLVDDGRGFDPDLDYEGLGLIGMKERVVQMGGEISIRSKPGNGTETVIVLSRRPA